VRRAVAWILAACAAATAVRGEGTVVRTAAYAVEVVQGSVVSLTDARGTVLVQPAAASAAARVECIGTGLVARATDGGDGTALPLPGGGRLACGHALDAASGDLVLTQRVERCPPGVWGVTWSAGAIPPGYAIIVPGRSGVRLDAETPGDRHVFDYPMGWEAQLVIVEGAGRGFFVFADDAAGRFKRLTVTRAGDGWRLDFTTINDAPFDALTGCESVAWRLNTYEGDWRVPARRYRDWMRANLKPVPLSAKSPEWARDIRGCVITGMSLPLLDELARHFDPPQTLLYVPSWRAAGYDRDYPDYAAPLPELGPFLDRAHALGFRVMLHVNYFGVDPLNPLYREFRRHHVRSPWGAHDPEWWTWDRCDPPIKFAYINPASAAWRRHFVGAMTDLCRRFPVDALHLDQTLCIFNDHNGRIDGLNMIRGNDALHEELCAALPRVALSGEGLNEITCRREAFAQRHAWGLHHSEGTWDEAMLRCAHPVSSYLFAPFTTVYGYLGMVAPEQAQLYAAWNEAYEHFGVIPTLRPSAASLAAARSPGSRGAGAFLRQFLDEVRFWQRERLDPDTEGAWPADVAFPFRGVGGGLAVRTVDGRLLSGGRVISRTVHGLNGIEAPGLHMPGWAGHGGGRMFGLDPARRYALLPGAPDTHGFHVRELPGGLVLESAFAGRDLAVVRTREIRKRVADPARLLSGAISGWRMRDGAATESKGPLESGNGASFAADGGGLTAHPPYRGGAAGGEAFVRFRVQVPVAGQPRFASGVALRKGAVGPGRSDGVTFRVSATGQGRAMSNAVHVATDTATPLELDLASFAGRTVDLEIAVHPGPAGNPSFDWAVWVDPHVDAGTDARGRLAVGGTQRWACLLGPDGRLPLDGGAGVVDGAPAGTVFLLSKQPGETTLPLDLVTAPREVEVVVDGAPAVCRFAGAQPATCTVGGVERRGILAHPPNRGSTTVHVPLRLPATPSRFAVHAGIADGSTSDGVVFIVAVNGTESVRRRMLPGAWAPVETDLGRWAGREIVLSLTTDSDGAYDCDWAVWGEPRILPPPMPRSSPGDPG